MNTNYTLLLLICAYATSAHTKVYSHKTNKQQLVFFGSLHIHDPQNSQYKNIKRHFKSFIQEAKNKKVILIEGVANNINKNKTEEDVINTAADRDFAALLGLKKNIPVINADLNKQTQIHYLLEKHPLETVYAYSKKLLTHMWKRFSKAHQPTFDEYVTAHLQIWFDGIDLTPLNNASIEDSLYHLMQNTLLKQRQEHTFKVIQKYWDQGYDIFIVYGNDHALAHEQKIKTLLK